MENRIAKPSEGSAEKLPIKYFHWLEVIYCLVLLVIVGAMFLFGYKLVTSVLKGESIGEHSLSCVATDVRNLDVDVKDNNEISFKYKEGVIKTKENINVKNVLLYVYFVSVVLISLLFLFLVINHIHNNVALHKKLYFLNEKYEEAVEQYPKQINLVYEKKTNSKDEHGISEKRYPDMKELFKAYSNALLEL